MAKLILEICVDSLESVVAASRGGADRIELCANLIIGGTTPTESFIKKSLEVTDTPLNIMIRPRFGDFCYSDFELEVMEAEIKSAKNLGVNGVVFGVLLPDGNLNVPAMKRLRDAAGDMECTLHRCFDVCADAKTALEDAIEIGMTTILTSGQEADCITGVENLKKINEWAKGRIDIMAGAGLKTQYIKEIYEKAGITSFHMSAKERVTSPMIYKNEKVHMGLPGFSEYEKDLCKEELVAEAKAVIKNR